MPPSGSRSEASRDPARRVVIVEDNPDTALLIEHALSGPDLGVEILAFRRGQAALDQLHGTDGTPPLDPLPAFILLDIKLPRLDGVEVLERLRDEPRTRLVPVVIFTSSDERSDLKACYDHGANSYIRKPVDFDRFTDTLSEVARYWLSVNHLAYDPAEPGSIQAPGGPMGQWDEPEA